MPLQIKATRGAIERRTNLNLPDITQDFTPDELHIFRMELMVLHAEYGEDSHSREQTAAHEAAHSVMTAALGWRFDEARVAYDRGAWVGETRWHHRLAGKVFRKVDEPDHLFATAIQYLAGRCGEKQAGLFHPASSIDERCSAAFLCRDLDSIGGFPAGTSYKRAEAIAMRTIAANAKVFDEFRGLLEQKRHVRAREGRRLLQPVEPVGLAWIERAPDLLTAATTSGRSRRAAVQEAAEPVERSKKDSG